MGNAALEKYVESCRDAGVPQQQLHAFSEAGYMPQPKQAEFHAMARRFDNIDIPLDVPLRLGFGGARGPGKTHAVVEQICDDCDRVPGLQALMLRRTGAALDETLIGMANLFHGWGAVMKGSAIVFPNGSRATLGHFRNPNDVDRHLGQNRDVIAIEESTTLTEAKITAIGSTCRSVRRNWRTRMYETTNPGGVSHHRYKRVFIDRRYRGREAGEGFHHIQATVDDNIILMQNDPAYVRRLDEFTGWEYRAYRLGSWEIAAGAFFRNWDSDVHVIKPFEIPAAWKRWASFDYGWTHPNVVQFHAMDGDGTVYTTHEIVRRRTPISLIAQKMKAAGYDPQTFGRVVAGQDCFSAKANGKEIADTYRKHGIPMEPATVARIPGWSEVAERLGDAERKIPPRWYVFDNCRDLIEQVGRMPADPAKPGDILKQNADAETGEGGDDSMDAARYGLMKVARRKAGTKPPTGGKPTPRAGTIMPTLSDLR